MISIWAFLDALVALILWLTRPRRARRTTAGFERRAIPTAAAGATRRPSDLSAGVISG